MLTDQELDVMFDELCAEERHDLENQWDPEKVVLFPLPGNRRRHRVRKKRSARFHNAQKVINEMICD